jgi:DNA-binding response OmpR family regulator
MESARPRVLIVDGEPEVVNCLRRLVRRQFEVETATSPEEALDKLERFDPDVVISESRMMRMSGRELLRRVRNRRPETLRVMMSGWVDPSDTWGDDRTANRYLNKPFETGDLLTAIRELLNERARKTGQVPVYDLR